MAVPETVRSGISSLQISIQYLHLVEKGQPLGGFSRSGGVPGMEASSCLFSRSRRGTDSISAQV